MVLSNFAFLGKENSISQVKPTVSCYASKNTGICGQMHWCTLENGAKRTKNNFT